MKDGPSSQIPFVFIIGGHNYGPPKFCISINNIIPYFLSGPKPPNLKQANIKTQNIYSSF